jgi:Holliday junction resolvase RusA-like endonuclease
VEKGKAQSANGKLWADLMIIHFRLPLPPSVNAYKKISRFGQPYTTKACQKWKNEAGWMAVLQFREQSGRLFTGDISVSFLFEKRGDLDNRIKPTLDMLQEMHVFRDDSQVVEIIARFADIEGCEVKVEDFACVENANVLLQEHSGADILPSVVTPQPP